MILFSFYFVQITLPFSYLNGKRITARTSGYPNIRTSGHPNAYERIFIYLQIRKHFHMLLSCLLNRMRFRKLPSYQKNHKRFRKVRLPVLCLCSILLNFSVPYV
jgi:hypothetical protein